MTNGEKYDVLRAGVETLRAAGNETAEDVLLDEMDRLWWKLTSAEKAARDDFFGRKHGCQDPAAGVGDADMVG